MDSYLIAFDMDGTLLNDKKNISFLTKHYLKKLSRQGHKIVLASGRPSRAMNRYYDELGLSTPMICYNGAYLFSPKDKNFKAIEFEFPKEIICEVIDKIRPHIKNVMCEDEENIWVDKRDDYLDKFFWYNNMNVIYGDLVDTLHKNPMTCIVQTPFEYRNEHEIEKIMEAYPNLSARFWTGSPYFELYYQGTSKGASLQKVAEYYHIPKERIIAFGDAENDREMLSFAGIPVAMSNGKVALQDVAKYVSRKDNNHNGIYHTLKRIFKEIK